MLFIPSGRPGGFLLVIVTLFYLYLLLQYSTRKIIVTNEHLVDTKLFGKRIIIPWNEIDIVKKKEYKQHPAAIFAGHWPLEYSAVRIIPRRGDKIIIDQRYVENYKGLLEDLHRCCPEKLTS